MLRFSVRDLLWLTLVVAMGLACWINSERSRAELGRTQDALAKWRGAAGALEYVLTVDGCIVDWQLYPSSVTVMRRYDGGGSSCQLDLDAYQPSVEDRWMAQSASRRLPYQNP